MRETETCVNPGKTNREKKMKTKADKVADILFSQRQFLGDSEIERKVWKEREK